MKAIWVCEKRREELASKKANLQEELQIAGAPGTAIIAKKHVASCIS